MNPSFGSIQPTAFPVRTAMGPVSGNLWRTAHPRASVLLVHGLGEHGGRYAAFASELAAGGFTTAALDWPGHGRSPGPRGNASWSAMGDVSSGTPAAERGAPRRHPAWAGHRRALARRRGRRALSSGPACPRIDQRAALLRSR